MKFAVDLGEDSIEESPAALDEESLQPDSPTSDADPLQEYRELRRRVFFRDDPATSSSTDSDDDTSPEDTDSHGSKSSDAESGEKAAGGGNEWESSKPWPKDTWSPVRSLFSREVGFLPLSPRPATRRYQTECGASLSLVQRLECSRNLDHHQGCVNALHFNRSGFQLNLLM